ncbi:MAG: hypothetical protein DCF28_13575 [Alphaproteobacteria bacterium]|nr:MAG: hypothetical protein DCF28_13575 [Alphaproteobacteria bacterium]PZO36593.1 MAG: hypothetical protein DCE92_08715 [Alphaproteobacteria bacterium]
MSRLVESNEDMSAYSAWQASKFRWHETILEDTNLSNLSVRVAGLLLHKFNFEKGHAWRSQLSMAEGLKIDVRSVRRAIAELVKGGYLSVKVSRGRGHSNECSFIAPVEASEAVSSVPEKRTPVSGVPVLTVVQKRTLASEKADTGVPPYLEETSTSPLPLTSRRRRRRQPEPQPKPAPSWPAFRDLKVRTAIVQECGEPFVRSYLDQAAWEPNGKQVVCRLSTGHARLRDKAAKRLSEMGVRLVLDPTLHARLPRPLIPMDEAA